MFFGRKALTLASALLHQILSQEDISVWTELKESYLPQEYKSLWKVVNSHVDRYGRLPSFEDLKFEIRDSKLQEMVFAIESVETEIDAHTLLDYQKNEYTQNVRPGVKQTNLVFKNPIKTVFAPQVRAKKASVSETEEKEEEKEEAA